MEKTHAHHFHPLELALDAVDGYHVIGTVEEASNVLLERWPTDSGPLYDNAVQACVRALNNKLSADEARAALIGAAEEVSIEVRG